MNHKKRISIIGATGYVGMELVRLLAGHDQFELSCLASQSYSGQPYSSVYPAFRGVVDQLCCNVDLQMIAQSSDVVVTALPHGVSSETVPRLLDMGARVLDHSGDFRYRDVHAYETAYHLTHPVPGLLSEAVYGLPELYRDKIAGARLVANPGCYPTCSILALVPALKAGAIAADGIIIDAVSGLSGAGRKSDVAFSFAETTESFRAYSVGGHRHTSEIEQELSLLSGTSLSVTFTPHLAPMKRGMLVTAYADLAPDVTAEDLLALYKKYYKDEHFVRVMPAGFHPDTHNVTGTNFADIAVYTDAHTGKAILVSAIDNLGKGAAAQAVQSLNIMMGFDEQTGLTHPGMMI